MIPGNKPYKVLIVSQTFPPDAGIGGRRWAKFSKSLAAKGCRVEVIAATLPGANMSLWSDDVKGINVFRYQSRFPKSLTIKPSSVLEKMKYKIAHIRARIRAKGTPYDRALFDERDFSVHFKQRMQAFNPDIVVVSGPPFNLLWYASKLRKQYPSAKFIADLRDPWTAGDLYGYSSLQNQAKTYEMIKETDVVKAFDLILTPWPTIQSEMSLRFPQQAEKIKVLGHCWDLQDMPVMTASNVFERELIYGGNLYEGFEPFLNELAKLAEKFEWKVTIFSTSPFIKKGESGYFQVRQPVPSTQFFQELTKSKFALFLIPEGLKDGFPTKLLEYAACARPFLAVGYEGTLSQLITSRGLGTFINIRNAATQFESAWKQEIIRNPDREWIDRQELTPLTDYFLSLVENIN